MINIIFVCIVILLVLITVGNIENFFHIMFEKSDTNILLNKKRIKTIFFMAIGSIITLVVMKIIM